MSRRDFVVFAFGTAITQLPPRRAAPLALRTVNCVLFRCNRTPSRCDRPRNAGTALHNLHGTGASREARARSTRDTPNPVVSPTPGTNPTRLRLPDTSHPG